MSGSIDFAEFLKVIENQKDRAENFDDENVRPPVPVPPRTPRTGHHPLA